VKLMNCKFSALTLSFHIGNNDDDEDCDDDDEAVVVVTGMT